MSKTWLRKGLGALMCGAVVLSGSVTLAEEAGKPKLNVGGVEATGTGSIKGVVKFAGEQKKRKPIVMAADKACTAAHTEPTFEEKFVFGDNDTLQNVLVYVSKGVDAKTAAAPATPHHVDQVGCTYVPHVSAIVAGQPLVIGNSDKTLHNVKFVSQKNGQFNEGSSAGSQIEKKLSKPEIAEQGNAPFKCDVHPWMSAYLHVMEHPFFAVTQEDGSFEIKGLPPGEYEVTTWHEFKAFKPDQTVYKVTVEEGKPAEVTVTYAPPAPKAGA